MQINHIIFTWFNPKLMLIGWESQTYIFKLIFIKLADMEKQIYIKLRTLTTSLMLPLFLLARIIGAIITLSNICDSSSKYDQICKKYKPCMFSNSWMNRERQNHCELTFRKNYVIDNYDLLKKTSTLDDANSLDGEKYVCSNVII